MATTELRAPTVTRRAVAPWVGLGAALVLVAAALAVPPLLDWDVRARLHGDRVLPPLHGFWDPGAGPGTVPAVVLALLAWRWAGSLSQRLPWRGLLATSYAAGLAWLLALAYVDGSSGISRVLGNDDEYLPTARATTDVTAMLREFVDRIPYAAPDNWPTHVAGHPPGALLVFVGLDRVGLGGDWAAGLVVTVVAASTAVAVLVCLRALGAEAAARTAAPYLVLAPAAVFMAVSADALFAAVAAWGLATLALAATARGAGPVVCWSVPAGLLLGSAVLMSYGLVLLGLPALAVLWLARSWRPLPVAAASALAVVLAFALGGFALWEAYPVLNERYWDGIAADRPAAYWLWGDLAALAICAGPLLGAGLAALVTRVRETPRQVVVLVTAFAVVVLVADLSRMSKAEVERIWLPFVPWLLLSVVALPERWRRPGLALQLVTALVVQHLLYTSW
ncbi:hypothetical protein ACT8ZV_17410 [Nocardioides sp. MAHUQ-72]|uniref:hypothetical protein n=1 Tax=unclassified Nocardioides TaxID=2615069 RepID=UPI003616AF7C